MDNPGLQPGLTDPTTNPQPPAPSTPAVNTAAKPDKPELDLPEGAIQDLLRLNNLQASQQPKTKRPIKLFVICLGLVTLAVVASLLIGSFKPGASSKSPKVGGGLGSPSQSEPANSNDVTNQINQDVKSCSNVVNATTVC